MASTINTLSIVKTMMKKLIETGGFDKVLEKVVVTSVGSGSCIGEMRIENEHKNRNGFLHGGLIATLIDSVTTMALKTEAEKFGVSVDMNITFMNAAKVGDEIVIEAKTLKTGKNLAFLTADIRNKSNGVLIAQGRHTKFIGETTPAR